MQPTDLVFVFFFFNDTATTEIYTLSLHDALPIWRWRCGSSCRGWSPCSRRSPASTSRRSSRCSSPSRRRRSEEHTSELQSQSNLVCRLLLAKKKQTPHLVLQYCHRHIEPYASSVT